MTHDGEKALRDIASIGSIQRILTSGLAPTAPQGKPMIKHLHGVITRSHLSIQLLVGSGINVHTVQPLLNAIVMPDWSNPEIHLSGGEWKFGQSDITARRDGMNMGAPGSHEWMIWQTMEANVRGVVEAATLFQNNGPANLVE